MKIGQFVEDNNSTIDAVRHYMDMGLIIPEKQGGQYDFDSRCQCDLEDIISLKGMGFSLSEIKSIFTFKRLGQLTQYQENQGYLEFFINKDKHLDSQIQELNQMKQRLEVRSKALSEKKTNSKSVIGIDLRVLDLLNCLKCGKDLELREGSVSRNQIIEGKLVCPCGEEYIIEDGILKIENIIIDEDIKCDSNFINDYISATDVDYLDKVYRDIEWLHRKADIMSFKDQVILELGSGMGFFLRAIYEDLPDDAIYIAVDHDINKHRFLKNILEMVGCKKNMMFICADFLQIPIKDNSVDILVDMSGTSNYCFENKEFLLKRVDHYIKKHAQILGSYLLFKNFATNSLIQDKCKSNFILNHVKQEILELGYNIFEENVSNTLEKGGKYESYFKEGEKVYSYLMLGKR